MPLDHPGEFSYSGDPQSSPKDAVRFEIQDTVEREALLSDAEIEDALEKEAGEEPDARGVLCASARCCEILARKFSAQADTVVGSLQTTYSKQAAGYAQRAKDLRLVAQGSGELQMPAISRSEKWRLRRDRNRVQPIFRRGQFQMHRRPAERGTPGWGEGE